jgi:hypothetical protein
MLTECALGVEIAEARDHVSIAAAGYIAGGFILVELAAYLEGTDPVAEVLRLQGERTVRAVALDPRSPAATAVAPLEDAGVYLIELSTHDVAVAHGGFVDALAAGRLGGVTAWERRGAPVDVSPAVACEIAVWALLDIEHHCQRSTEPSRSDP